MPSHETNLNHFNEDFKEAIKVIASGKYKTVYISCSENGQKSEIRAIPNKNIKLYHFTDFRNVESIKKYGLLSQHQLQLRDIPYHPTSKKPSRGLDSHRNLENYVRLCLQPHHPIVSLAVAEGRISHLVWLEIDEVVCRWRATLFCDSDINSNNVVINNDPRTAIDSDDVQAEVFVDKSLNPKWIEFPV
jgi:hypothetical protein